MQLWFEAGAIPNYLSQARSSEQIFLGLQTLETHSGFIFDGNRYFSVLQLNGEESELEEDYTKLDNRIGFFQSGQDINADAINSVKDILQFAQEHNITIIGVLLSFHPDFYAKFQTSNDYSYFNIASTALAETFSDYDFSDPSLIGSTIADFRDGVHFSERLASQIYLELVRQHPENLGIYTDAILLEDLIE